MARGHVGGTRGAVAAARRLSRFALRVPGAFLDAVVRSQAALPAHNRRVAGTMQEEAVRLVRDHQELFEFDSNEEVLSFLSFTGVPTETVLATCKRTCPTCGRRKPFSDFGRAKGGSFAKYLWGTHGIAPTCRQCKNARAAASKRAERYPPGTEPRSSVPTPLPGYTAHWANDPARTEDESLGTVSVGDHP